MPQEIEIEFKNLLQKDEFELLIRYFNIEDKMFVLQRNHYFDTDSFSLKALGSALRVRHKNGSYELTLKQPIEEGILETNQPLSSIEAMNLINDNKLPEGTVKELLKKLQLDISTLKHFGMLSTNRAEFPYKDGLLVLDHSTYLNSEDYEIEYEVNNAEKGKPIFLSLLSELKIPLRNTENKIKRFYNQKMNSKQEK